MTYVISDIHGCFDKYIAMLEKINFSDADTLYVLGDVIDRGPDGFKMMLEMASRPNVINLQGNHELMAIKALPHIIEMLCSEEDPPEFGISAIRNWFGNGGEVSLEKFLSLDADEAQTVWDYMLAMPLYQEIEVGERKFVLLHGGLEDFSPERELEDYDLERIVWCRPKTNTVYYPDKCVILGHTPTQFLNSRFGIPIKKGKIYKTDTYIDIDCGCVYFNGQLGCLCLDTMEEFYV